MLVSSVRRSPVCSVSSAWRSASRRLCALGGRAASVGVGFVSSSSLSSGWWVLSRSCRLACVFARVRRGASASLRPLFGRWVRPAFGLGLGLSSAFSPRAVWRRLLGWSLFPAGRCVVRRFRFAAVSFVVLGRRFRPFVVCRSVRVGAARWRSVRRFVFWGASASRFSVRGGW